jgi:hypothetical protein
MKAARLALLSLACLLPLAATAQWQWLDKDGRKVFSDQAPPPDIPAGRILKQPGVRAPAAAASANVNASANTTAAAAAAAPTGVDPALKPAGKDRALEEKRKQNEAAEAEKKKAQEAKVAEAREDNCRRARANKAGFESGQRIAYTNEKGEKEYMDDARRATELKRVEDIIARDCRKDRQ